jgi:hypothetical protein
MPPLLRVAAHRFDKDADVTQSDTLAQNSLYRPGAIQKWRTSEVIDFVEQPHRAFSGDELAR